MRNKKDKKISFLNQESRYKNTISIILGIISLGLIFVPLNIYIYNLKIGVGISLILPTIITLNWGIKQGLISIVIGLVGFYPFIIFTNNIPLATLIYINNLIFIILQGIGFNSRKNIRNIYNNKYFLQIIYSLIVIAIILGYEDIFNIRYIERLSINFFILKEIVSKFIILSISNVFTKVVSIKKLFKIESNGTDIHNTKIILSVISIGMTFTLIIISITRYIIEEDRSFSWIIEPNDKERFVYLMIMSMLIVVSGIIIDLYEKIIRAVKEADKNRLDYIEAKYKQKEIEDLYKLILDKSLNSVVIYEPIYDKNNNLINLKNIYANKSYCELIGKINIDMNSKSKDYGIELDKEILNKYSQILKENKDCKYIEIYDENLDKYFLINGFKIKEDRLALIILDISSIIKTRNELNSILESTDEFIWVVDSDYKLIKYNSSLFKYIKKQYNLDLKEDLDYINKFNKYVTNWEEYYKTATKVGRFKIERISIKGGLELEVTFNPIYKNNQINKIAIFGKDVTEKNKAKDDLLRLNLELEEKIMARTKKLQVVVNELEAFNYTVAHDIKSPLRAIETHIRFTLEDHIQTLDNEIINTLKEIQKITLNMINMTNRLLDYSCTSLSNVDKTLINIEKIFKEVFNEIKLLNRERKIELKFKMKLPKVNADETLIRILIYNLLSNAIKFTKYKDKAYIEIGYIEKEKKCIFYVKDNGVGFNGDYSNKLFNLFERVHSNDEFEGSGIGLTTAKKIIQKHNGEIWIESEVNKGTIVYFSLLEVN